MSSDNKLEADLPVAIGPAEDFSELLMSRFPTAEIPPPPEAEDRVLEYVGLLSLLSNV